MSTYTIGNVVLNVPYMNAACSVAKTPEDIKALCQTSAGAVLIGSITRLARDGNAEKNTVETDFGIIEAENMNEALDKAAKMAGYIDHADIAQELGWEESEFNIVKA